MKGARPVRGEELGNLLYRGKAPFSYSIKENNTFLQEATTMMNTNNTYFENLYRIG